MFHANITRDEARTRSHQLRVESYEVLVDLTGRGADGAPLARPDATFVSTTRIRVSSIACVVNANLIADELSSLVLDGRELPAEVFDGEHLTVLLGEGDHELTVTALMRFSRTGEGLHRFVDPADDRVYLYSQFEVADARRMFATFEQPDLKATFQFSVLAPASWTVLSNSPAVAPSEADEGVRRWEFAPTPRMSTYITALCAGEFHSVTDAYTRPDGSSIPLSVHVRASLAPHLDADRILTTTKRGFAVFERHFGCPYPFGDYAQVFVPEFNFGAMENAGCITFRDEYIFRSRQTSSAYESRDNTILHEMAHMWFGDLVTMRWWDDLWLNESFAEWASTTAQAEATRWKTAWTTFATAEKNWAYRQDQLSSTHPIVAPIRHLEDVEANFDGITYAKGASVLKQLVAYVGRDAFREGLRAYFRAHAWGNTTMADLLRELEAASGRDLAIWSDLWLNTAGVNTLRAELAIEDGTITAASLTQTAVAEHPTLRPHRLAIGLYDLTDGGSDGSDGSDSTGRRLVRRERFEVNIDGPSTTLPDLVGVRMPDFLLVNDDDLAYAKIRIDERSLAAVQAAPTGFTDSLPQALVLGAMWDMTRDAQLPAPDFVRFVLECLPAEKDSTLVRVLLSQVESATRFYTSPAHRPELAALVAHRLRALAESAEPGSDAQLQFVTAFAGWARSVEDLDLVEGLLEGSRELPGLAVDTEMRWTLLTSLAVGGRANEERIDAERRRDDTATGRERAALALAARPTSEAKEAAWVAAVETPGLPNQTIDAMAAGFGRVHDTSLLAPYVQRYHDALVGIWESRTFAIAESIVLGFYPLAVADEDLLAASQGWLDAHPDAPDALVRLAAENRDSIARALQAQACDAADD